MTISFDCQQCGNCCRFGWQVINGKTVIFCGVTSSKKEAETIGLNYYELDGGEYYLKCKEDQSCIFLIDNRCSIHDRKPYNCEQFPIENGRFIKTKVDCPAIKINKTN